MDESQWLACTSADEMLAHVGPITSERRLGLFASACVRWGDENFYFLVKREALIVAERHCDGQATPEDLARAKGICKLGDEDRPWLAADLAWHSPMALSVSTNDGPHREMRVRIVRCLFGNPFRPILLDPKWLAEQIIGLARAAYAERLLPSGELDPARIAVLSDALEDAGAGPGLLDHLRWPHPHVRGCHAVDQCLRLS